ncbi:MULTISPECIES: hypothetical protein [unclassified Candidatus Frackibacter]|uniref:hypothetical protein n=1 Tax=unclassified Candidatus Frackibacter TaxID=2648818 RepID=UPI0007959D8C|nr:MULTISPECIES: hypothetical protein [unclassified Candidatus Frackibacter]KXS42357.1 MAG: hypothetical protein AWU54_1356 [Candidatus Frackibacter sp. T328-2]SDC68577.1 hypothetical protein SAMN04515661_11934 [Candidatus Frackibacter sp. WG11]SEM83104.1 hypothetical protein SAMN04488698_11929 [Candidatus Frackibacter sp. WG12]SFL92177.1 hypothetical protein SAMN04488699_12034 [Candidatus Frackibacter sp. WG13]
MQISIMKSLFFIYVKDLLLVYVGLGINSIKLSKMNYFKILLYFTAGEIIVTILLGKYITNIHVLKSYILCLLLILLYKRFANIDWLSAVISSLSGYVIYLLGGFINLQILSYFFSLKTDVILKSDYIYSIIFYLFNFPLLISAWLIYRFNFILFDLDDEEFKFGHK